MKSDNPTLNALIQPGWQILGELNLHVGSHEDSALRNWLTEIVSPLDLHLDFLDKVLTSARDGIRRAWHGEVRTEPRYLRFRVLAPARRQPEGCTWGFFRLEKVNGAVSQDPPLRTIEIYLYLES